MSFEIPADISSYGEETRGSSVPTLLQLSHTPHTHTHLLYYASRREKKKKRFPGQQLNSEILLQKLFIQFICKTSVSLCNVAFELIKSASPDVPDVPDDITGGLSESHSQSFTSIYELLFFIQQPDLINTDICL